MTSAGWSNEMTFQRYYHKPADNTFNFGGTILQLTDSDNLIFVFIDIQFNVNAIMSYATLSCCVT